MQVGDLCIQTEYVRIWLGRLSPMIDIPLWVVLKHDPKHNRKNTTVLAYCSKSKFKGYIFKRDLRVVSLASR